MLIENRDQNRHGRITVLLSGMCNIPKITNLRHRRPLILEKASTIGRNRRVRALLMGAARITWAAKHTKKYTRGSIITLLLLYGKNTQVLGLFAQIWSKNKKSTLLTQAKLLQLLRENIPHSHCRDRLAVNEPVHMRSLAKYHFLQTTRPFFCQSMQICLLLRRRAPFTDNLSLQIAFSTQFIKKYTYTYKTEMRFL